MPAVKFVHVLKRIESLERDIKEIHALQAEVNVERSYSTPIKISLEQQVNTLLNEKTKLMEVRIDNPPEQLITENRKKPTASSELESRPGFSFENYEELYFKRLYQKRTQTTVQPAELVEPATTEKFEEETREKSQLPSLAEKSLVKKETGLKDQQSSSKRRADLLKDLPPLEY
ncbi:MAG: hypothetical protein ABUK01_18200 [Leptospirales bacterium]